MFNKKELNEALTETMSELVLEFGESTRAQMLILDNDGEVAFGAGGEPEVLMKMLAAALVRMAHETVMPEHVDKVVKSLVGYMLNERAFMLKAEAEGETRH